MKKSDEDLGDLDESGPGKNDDASSARVQDWPKPGARVADTLAFVVAALLGVLVAANLTLPGRPVVALVFFVAVPGWVTLRAFGMRASSFTAFAGCGLSVAITMIVGQVLSSGLGWPWRGATLILCGASAAGALVKAMKNP